MRQREFSVNVHIDLCVELSEIEAKDQVEAEVKAHEIVNEMPIGELVCSGKLGEITQCYVTEELELGDIVTYDKGLKSEFHQRKNVDAINDAWKMPQTYPKMVDIIRLLGERDDYVIESDTDVIDYLENRATDKDLEVILNFINYRPLVFGK